MDLSKFSDKDFEVLSKGKLSDLSDQGLLEYERQNQHQAQVQQQAANPEKIADSADKASQNGNPKALPISLTKQAQARSQTALEQFMSQMTSKESWDKAAKTSIEGADYATSPEGVGRMALGSMPIPISPAIGALKGFLGKGASMATKATSSGAANDLLGVVSPRAAKLASFLGKVLPKEAESAALEALPATAPIPEPVQAPQLSSPAPRPKLSPNWDFPIRKN